MRFDKLEHVGEHPHRLTLKGVGGLPLSPIRLLLQQFCCLNGSNGQPDYDRGGLPRRWRNPLTGEVSVYNGGSPWADTHNPKMIAPSIAAGLSHSGFGLNDVIVLDYENEEVNVALATNNDPYRISKSLATYATALNAVPGREGPWAFPRHEWLKTVRDNTAQFREVLQTTDRLHLDTYHWHTNGTRDYLGTIMRLSDTIELLGFTPAQCVAYARPLREGGRDWLTPDEIAADFAILSASGYRHVVTWHPGDKWRNLEKDTAFYASRDRCIDKDIRAVLDSFAPK